MSPVDVRRAVEIVIEQTRQKAGLAPVFNVKRKVGRPMKHVHPLPRREKKSWEQLDTKTHASDHQSIYVETCPMCYAREYAFFQRHPELKTAGPGSSPKPWVDHGWVEHKAKKDAKTRETGERRRFIRTKGRS